MLTNLGSAAMSYVFSTAWGRGARGVERGAWGVGSYVLYAI